MQNCRLQREVERWRALYKNLQEFTSIINSKNFNYRDFLGEFSIDLSKLDSNSEAAAGLYHQQMEVLQDRQVKYNFVIGNLDKQLNESQQQAEGLTKSLQRIESEKSAL